MYKIYVNDTPILLVDTAELSSLVSDSDKKLIGMYTGKTKYLLHFIDMLEKTKRYESVTIHSDQPEKLFTDFCSLYKRIDAAGGVVYNEEQEILMIYRLGCWDLPKGKVDKGESIEEAAVREVEEETGIEQVKRGALLTTTLHTYQSRKGKRILKTTYWYTMHTHKQDLTPQLEEDITEAIWQQGSDFLASSPDTYNSIREVIEQAVSLEK